MRDHLSFGVGFFVEMTPVKLEGSKHILQTLPESGCV